MGQEREGRERENGEVNGGGEVDGVKGRGALMEFQRFLMALAVRPGSILAMFDHLVPICCTCEGEGGGGGDVSGCVGRAWRWHQRSARWWCE